MSQTKMDNNRHLLQIRLVTKQNINAVPNDPLSFPSGLIDCEYLNKLVNTLLKENNPEYFKAKSFDFLVAGELLRIPLEEHLQERSVPLESLVEIEYVESFPAPEPQDSLLHDDWVSTIESNNTHILTGCYDHSVGIWTIHGKPVTQLREHTNIIKGVTWIDQNDPTRGFVSVSHDLKGIIWSWDPNSNTSEPSALLRGHEKGIDSVSVSPNTERIATGGWDRYLKIWSSSLGAENEEHVRKKRKGSGEGIVTKVPLNTLKGHTDTISSLKWVANDVVCTASSDHTIKFWDAETCGMKNEIFGQKAFLNVSWSSLTNMIIASSADRHIRLYDPRSIEGAVCKTTFTSHKGWVSSVAWSKYDEHIFLSGGYDSLVKVWDTRSSKAPLYDLQGHEGKVLCVDFSNNKFILSGGTDNIVHIFKNKVVN